MESLKSIDIIHGSMAGNRSNFAQARMRSLFFWALLAVSPAAPAWAEEPGPAPEGEAAQSAQQPSAAEPAAPQPLARPKPQEEYLPTIEDILASPSTAVELQYETPAGWQEYGVVRHVGRKSVELLGEAGKTGKDIAVKMAGKGAEIAVEAGRMGKDAAVKMAETGKEVAIMAAETGKEVAIKAAEKGVEVAKKAEKIIDEQHDWFSGEVETTAALVDAYFDNENSTVEGNKTQIKFSMSAMYEEGKGLAPGGGGLDIKLVMPRFEKKLHLIISGIPEEESSSKSGSPSKLAPIKKAEEIPTSAAFRYFLLAMDTQNLSLDGGMDVKDLKPVFFSAGRYRLHVDLHPWDMRFTQWVRYYTDTEWQATTKLEFERLLGDAWLLRLSAESSWYQELKGYYYYARAEVYHTLNPESVLQYAATANFKSWPENRLTDPVLRAVHRRKIWREWFYIEGGLQGSWPEERYYKFIPLVYLRMEALFGNVPTKVGKRK